MAKAKSSKGSTRSNTASAVEPLVRHEQCFWCDFYFGTKQALIESGTAKDSWFPAHDLPGKRPGTTKRSFDYVSDDGLAVNLTQRHPYNSDRWTLRIKVTEEERARRKRDQESAREQREQQELRRIFPTLTDRHQQTVLRFAYELQALEQTTTPRDSSPKPHLTLVVNNDARQQPQVEQA